MTNVLTLKPTAVANGGAGIARDANNRPIFIPFTIPGETVTVRLTEEKAHFAHAELLAVLEPAPERIPARCPHFGLCGGCHFQHMGYEAQLAAKRQIVADQLQRIGGITAVTIPPVIPNPNPWGYRAAAHLTPSPEGRLGYWSPVRREVMGIDVCYIIHPDLLTLWQDIDLELPGLRQLTLRRGDDEALLAALEIEDVEPPELETDFPVSVAIVLPDETAVSLIGDNYLIQSVGGRDFRVSPGCYFAPSPAMLGPIIETILAYAQLSGRETVTDAYRGVGFFTAGLAPHAAAVRAIEINPDAIADTAVNLNHTDNVAVYEGWVEEVLPALPTPDLLLIHPPEKGLSKGAMQAVTRSRPPRLIYVSSDVATLARDGKQLTQAGYTLHAIQPLDTAPQTYHMETVSLWLLQ
jgi:23S rRNA (uracil1939-C5)-methyltransferase